MAGDVSGGMAGVLQEELPARLRAQGLGALEEKLLLARMKFNAPGFQRDPFGSAVSVLNRRAKQLESPTLETSTPQGAFGGVKTQVPATEANVEKATDLRELAGILSEMKTELQKLNGTASQQLQKSPGGTTLVQPNND